jgi:hypothetical protein
MVGSKNGPFKLNSPVLSSEPEKEVLPAAYGDAPSAPASEDLPAPSSVSSSSAAESPAVEFPAPSIMVDELCHGGGEAC